MPGLRALAGLALLCALIFSAFAAQGASAAGTSAFTCAPAPGVKPVGALKFSDEHCEKEATGAAVKFVHEAITGKTEVIGTNDKTANETKDATPVILHTILGGFEITIECKKTSGTGTIENTVNGAKENVVVGTGITVNYSECTVPKPLKAGVETCQVKEPIVATGTSTTVKQENVTISPNAGKNFTEITIQSKAPEKCNVAGTYPVTGTVIGVPSGPTTAPGATLTFKGEGTLKIGEAAAQLTGTTTGRMSGAGGNPISGTRT